MRHTQQVLLLGLHLPALLLAGPALAQTGVDMSWSALDPGDDWAATVVRSVFPVGGSTGTVSTGNAAIPRCFSPASTAYPFIICP